MVHDFWGPFFFGFVWLVAALAVVWVLKRPVSHRLALRSVVARVLAWILVVFCLTVFVLDLPYSLGVCRGGLDDPVRCWAVPAGIVEPLAAAMLFLVLAGLLVVPLLLGGMLVMELLKRRRS